MLFFCPFTRFFNLLLLFFVYLNILDPGSDNNLWPLYSISIPHYHPNRTLLLLCFLSPFFPFKYYYDMDPKSPTFPSINWLLVQLTMNANVASIFIILGGVILHCHCLCQGFCRLKSLKYIHVITIVMYHSFWWHFSLCSEIVIFNCYSFCIFISISCLAF